MTPPLVSIKIHYNYSKGSIYVNTLVYPHIALAYNVYKCYILIMEKTIDCCDERIRDECPIHKIDYWFAWVWVAVEAPDVRYSRFFDSKKEAQTMIEPMKGTKLIKVKVYANR